MNQKRFWGILLCICLLCTSVPVTKSSAATNISVVSITVTEPAIGAKPVAAASVPEDAKYYVKEVSWGSVKTFRANTAYTVSLLIAVKDGTNAQFNSRTSISASVNGKKAEWYHSNYQPGKELYVKYRFPAMKGATVSKKSVAISNADDLKKMSDNPEGNYHLTKDITVPKNTQIFDDFTSGAAFTGTFDGKGHKIKGYTANVSASEYTRVSLFGNTSDATFKNLTLSGVNVKVKSDTGALVSALCSGSAKCSKVTVTGNLSVSGNADVGTDGMDCEIYGLCWDGTFQNCTNKANISADYDAKLYYGSMVAGIANTGTFKNCKNTGTISSKGSQNLTDIALGAAGISIGGTLTGCKNAGTIKAEGKARTVYAVGVSYAPRSGSRVSKCSNSGKISAKNNAKTKTYAAGVAGVLTTTKGCNKCSNSGTVSIIQQDGSFCAGGVFADVGGLTRECYNTGKVSVKVLKNTGKHMGEIGGVVGNAYRISECYNTGKVSSNADGDIGGVGGMSTAWENWTVMHCYNTGKVSAKKGLINVGGILGSYTSLRGTAIGKYYVYDNYSTTSPVYGASRISWAPYRARGKKVSSISKKNCPKLSSKYWTYSKKHKRLILKNVKEK